jgi:hypothetical protein
MRDLKTLVTEAMAATAIDQQKGDGIDHALDWYIFLSQEERKLFESWLVGMVEKLLQLTKAFDKMLEIDTEPTPKLNDQGTTTPLPPVNIKGEGKQAESTGTGDFFKR